MKEISKFLNKLLKDSSRSIVGRLCKRVELIFQDKSLSNEQREKLLKGMIRELIYEIFRDILNQAKCYFYGLTYKKYDIYEPTDKQ